MPLKQYQAKRDFKTSPEPKGDETKALRRKKTKTLFFCVQKHLASHLHYDLRLEHQGVLMSWAVPKGPSLDSKIKRFAQQVEDCLLYTSPSPRDRTRSRMPSSA